MSNAVPYNSQVLIYYPYYLIININSFEVLLIIYPRLLVETVKCFIVYNNTIKFLANISVISFE